METLREIYRAADFHNIRSYLQSGNVIFETPVKDLDSLAKDIERQLQRRCGFHIDVLLRQIEDFQAILTNNPFLRDRQEDPSKLHVTFLFQVPSDESMEKLILPGGINDEFVAGSQAIYLFCPNGYGKTKLSNSFFERRLGVLTTTRNWNTVTKLYKLALEDSISDI